VPPGMADLLVRHHSDYGLPMYTTENGGASRLRFARRVYLDPYLRATDEAIARGAEIRAYFLWSLRDNFPNLLDHDPHLVGAARVLEQGCGRYLRKVRAGPSGPARFVLRGAPGALGLVQLGRGEVPRVAAADAAGDEDATVEKPRHAAGQTSGVHRAGRAQLAGRRIEQLTCG
jgi:hypothetical protein